MRPCPYANGRTCAGCCGDECTIARIIRESSLQRMDRPKPAVYKVAVRSCLNFVKSVFRVLARGMTFH